MKFLACCKKFVEFQINLFSKDGTFPLKQANCDYTWARTDYQSYVNFDYNNNFFEIYYSNVSDDGSSDEEFYFF